MNSNKIRLPDYHYLSPDTAAIVEALSKQTEKLEAARDSLFEQFHVNTATWGLTLREKALGLETDVSSPDDWRRSRVLSKMRGQGVINTTMIANVAASFSGGEIEIIERPGDYAFDVKFVGIIGTPPNMDDLTAAIDEIKPAHLLYRYIYSYLLIRDIHGVMTLNELEQTELSKFAGGNG